MQWVIVLTEKTGEIVAKNPNLALITGAAGRMGKVIALELAAAGYDIALHYNSSAAKAKETAREIEALGRRVSLVRADLSKTAHVSAMFRKLADMDGTLKITVNAAGIMPAGNLKTLTLAEWEQVIAVNTTAPFLVGQQAYHLMQAEGGLLVNIIDIGAEKGWSGFPQYTVSKAALQKLTELQARSYAPAVRVNGISPGLIAPAPDFDPARWQKLLKKVPLKRQGDFSDIARTVLFLSENPYITGEIISVDGGYRLS